MSPVVFYRSALIIEWIFAANACNQIRTTRQSERDRKATDNGHDLALQSKRLQCIVDWSTIKPASHLVGPPCAMLVAASFLKRFSSVVKFEDPAISLHVSFMPAETEDRANRSSWAEL